MLRMFPSCTAIMAFMGCLCPIYGQTNGLSVDKEHVSSVAEAHLASLEGWRTGDALIRYSRSGDGKLTARGVGEVVGPEAMSIVDQEDYLARFIFDFDSERVLVINRVEREERMFNSLDEEVQRPVKRVDNRVLLYDRSRNHELHRLDAGVVQRVKKMAPMIQAIRSFGVPDMRHFGCSALGNWVLDDLREPVKFANTVENIEQLTHVGKNVYRIVAKDLELKRRSGQYSTDWDLQRNVPVRYESYDVYKVPNKHGPTHTATVDWISIDGHLVPMEAHISQRFVRPRMDLDFHIREETVFEIHWFSFNQELSAEFFDEKLIHDRKKLDELLKTDVFEEKPKQETQGK
jgi:hypothetical protein